MSKVPKKLLKFSFTKLIRTRKQRHFTSIEGSPKEWIQHEESPLPTGSSYLVYKCFPFTHWLATRNRKIRLLSQAILTTRGSRLTARSTPLARKEAVCVITEMETVKDYVDTATRNTVTTPTYINGNQRKASNDAGYIYGCDMLLVNKYPSLCHRTCLASTRLQKRPLPCMTLAMAPAIFTEKDYK